MNKISKNLNSFNKGQQSVDQDPCLICGIDFLNSQHKKDDQNNFLEEYQLKCNHKFHYDCLAINFNHEGQFKKGWSGNQCPLCRTKIGYLPLKKNYPILEYTHKEFRNDIKNLSVKKKQYKCKGIIQSGKNIGKQCICKTSTKGGYCGKHYGQKNKKNLKVNPKIKKSISNISGKDLSGQELKLLNNKAKFSAISLNFFSLGESSDIKKIKFCQGICKNGSSCHNYLKIGSNYCWLHQKK